MLLAVLGLVVFANLVVANRLAVREAGFALVRAHIRQLSTELAAVEPRTMLGSNIEELQRQARAMGMVASTGGTALFLDRGLVLSRAHESIP